MIHPEFWTTHDAKGHEAHRAPRDKRELTPELFVAFRVVSRLSSSKRTLRSFPRIFDNITSNLYTFLDKCHLARRAACRGDRVDTREAVFIISVAARLVDMHPSTLRKYERCGLLEPCRMSGRLRLYSPEDIERLRQIKVLVEDRGINLAGVEMALGLVERVQEVRHLADAEQDVGKLRIQLRAIADEMLDLLSADPADDRRSSPKREATRQ